MAAGGMSREKCLQILNTPTPLENPRFQEILPDTRYLHRQVHDDLTKAFAAAGKQPSNLRLRPRRFQVWWRGEKGDPLDPFLRGWVEIEGGDVPMDELQTSKNKIVSGVKIGNIEGFPLDGSILYYYLDDDMLYIFPVEEIGRKPFRKVRYVYDWYTFTDILRLDSEGAGVGFSERRGGTSTFRANLRRFGASMPCL
jgi:hypothetical protein